MPLTKAATSIVISTAAINPLAPYMYICMIEWSHMP